MFICLFLFVRIHRNDFLGELDPVLMKLMHSASFGSLLQAIHRPQQDIDIDVFIIFEVTDVLEDVQPCGGLVIQKSFKSAKLKLYNEFRMMCDPFSVCDL